MLLWAASCAAWLGAPSLGEAREPQDRPFGKTVKEIRVSGLRYTERDLILRELASKTGEPYLEENQDKDLERLDRLRIFSSVEIHPVDVDGGIALDVRVRETFPVLPAISIDVKDEEGFSIGPALQFINFRGRAMKMSGAARFGGATTTQFELEQPAYSATRYPFRIEWSERSRPNKVDDFHERSSDLQFRLGRQTSEHVRLGGRFQFLSLASDTAGITFSADNRDNIPTLGVFAVYDGRDLWSNPRQGWRAEFEVARSGAFLGGDGNWWSFTFDLRRYQPVARRHGFAAYSLATLQSGEVGRAIPVYLDFPLGGTNSIRGWDRGAEQGKNQFINTVEYRFTFWGPKSWSIRRVNAYLGLQLALFADFGLAWDRSSDFRADQVIGGYGFGLRLLVPFVDVIRIDFAYGQEGTGLHRHIGLGEKEAEQRKRVR